MYMYKFIFTSRCDLDPAVYTHLLNCRICIRPALTHNSRDRGKDCGSAAAVYVDTCMSTTTPELKIVLLLLNLFSKDNIIAGHNISENS